MLLLREEIENPADAARRARGVDRAEHEVARLGGMDRRLEGLHVAELAHEDDVGILADGMLHADLEVLDVAADLPLIDQALILGEHELDRILEREDVLAVGAVDVVEHRPDRGALAGAGDPGQQHHPLVEHAEPLDALRQEEALEVGDRVVDAAGDHAHRSLLGEQVDAEPPLDAIDHAGVREIDAPLFLKDLPLPLTHDRHAELPHPGVIDLGVLERLERALHADDRWLVGLEVQVAATELDERLKQTVDLVAIAVGADRLGNVAGRGLDRRHGSRRSGGLDRG